MPEKYDFDMFTIGAGSGGVRASRIASGYGARVAVAEERYLGGTCVNVGCIPKKLFVYASEFGEAFEDAAGFGWTPGKPSFDWSRLIANKNHEIERLNGVYERLLTGAGAQIIRGRAEVIDPHTVAINGKRYTSEYPGCDRRLADRTAHPRRRTRYQLERSVFSGAVSEAADNRGRRLHRS